MRRRRTRTIVLPFTVAMAMAVALTPGIIGNASSPVFADDFESGSLTRWAETSGFTAQQQVVFGGTWAGRASVSGAPGFASATLEGAVTTISLEARVHVLSSSTTVTLLRLRAASGKGIVSLRLNANGRLSRRNEVDATSTTSRMKVTKGTWHLLRLDATVNGASSTADVWLDGVRVADASGTLFLGTNPVSRIQIGSQSAVTMDAAFDDARATSPDIPADTAAPSVPQDLRATTVTGSRVDLTWTASTDDTGVTGYGVYRGDSLIGTTSGTQTSFPDTTVAPLASYSYTVDAFDLAGNRSARSTPPLPVTTPGLDDVPPSVPTGLVGTPTNSMRVDLVWVAATDDVDVTGYTVYRDGNQIAAIGGAQITFTDTTVRPGVTYFYEVDATDAAGNRSARSAPAEVVVPDATLVAAAGDICTITPTGCVVTAGLVESLNPDAVLTLGDNQYESGTLAEYQGSYDREWGRFKSITKPNPGNHEWKTPNAQGYRDYFGPTFSTNGGTWYSFDLGGWHLVSLDTQCTSVGGCGPGSAQYAWLQQDLAADNHACTLAFWHRPRFSSGTQHGSSTSSQPFWNLLGAEGAELVLNGHEHSYERFAPQTPLALASATGIREMVVGTGGNCCYPFGTPIANSEIRINSTRGVLELALDPTSYAWRFTAVGGSVMDSGSGSCH